MDQDCKKVVTRWENLDTDILLKILENHFSIDELTSGLAHVCSGWRAVCCNPVLWDTVYLFYQKSITIANTKRDVFVDRRSDEEIKELTRILKVSMNLSKGNIRTLIVHFNLFLTDEMLTYTTTRCPNLRRLVLPSWNKIKKMSSVCDALNSCGKLESLTMPSMTHSHLFFSSLVKRSKYKELKVMGPIDLLFAESIVAYLPKLKVLSLRCIRINRDALIKILDKLKCLEVLNISHSYIVVEQQHHEKKMIIVRELDEVIMKKASKLKQFFTCTDKTTCDMCQKMEKKTTCVICQKMENDEGMMSWSMFDKDLWKADEVSSLHL